MTIRRPSSSPPASRTQHSSVRWTVVASRAAPRRTPPTPSQTASTPSRCAPSIGLRRRTPASRIFTVDTTLTPDGRHYADPHGRHYAEPRPPGKEAVAEKEDHVVRHNRRRLDPWWPPVRRSRGARRSAANQKTKVMAKLKRAMRERLQKKLAKKGKAKVKIIATATDRGSPWRPTRSR
jgi:hypothetical protein